MDDDLRKSIIRLCEAQSSSPIRWSKSAGRIKAFLTESGYSRDDIISLFRNPDRTLGPFDGLPKIFREGLSASAEFYIRERNLLSHGVALSLAYGPLSRFGGYVVHKGWKLRAGRLGWLHSPLLLLGRRAQHAGRNLARYFVRLFRYTQVYGAPFLYTLWKYVKFDPSHLIQDYINNIPVDPRLSPVFKDLKHGTISCGLVGIDFLPARGKLYFLEGNFNAGHSIKRHLLFPEGDPVCHHLTDWAVDRGYSKIVFFPNNHTGVFEKSLEFAWCRIANKKGIQLEIVDNPLIGSPLPRSRRMFMDPDSPGTLFVNGRYLAGPLARLIAEKGLLDQEIGRFNATVPIEARIPVPRVITDQKDIPPLDDAGLFPNVIVKNARMDKTQGISLYRSKHLPEGANSRPNIAYEYIIPDLVVIENRGITERHVYNFRAYLLITPDGPVYLGARKGISSAAIPSSLPLGMVEDKSPYITNRYAGNYNEVHSESEDQICKSAILSVGMVIDRFIKKKYDLVVEKR